MGFWEALARLAARVLPAGPPKHNIASVLRTAIDVRCKYERVDLTADDDKIIGRHVGLFKSGNFGHTTKGEDTTPYRYYHIIPAAGNGLYTPPSRIGGGRCLFGRPASRATRCHPTRRRRIGWFLFLDPRLLRSLSCVGSSCGAVRKDFRFPVKCWRVH